MNAIWTKAPTISLAENVSNEFGIGHPLLKCCSNAPFIETSMEVRFFRFLPCAAILSMEAEVPVVESASASHFFSSGISLHMFLKLSCRASNLKGRGAF